MVNSTHLSKSKCYSGVQTYKLEYCGSTDDVFSKYKYIREYKNWIAWVTTCLIEHHNARSLSSPWNSAVNGRVETTITALSGKNQSAENKGSKTCFTVYQSKGG